MKKLSLFHMLVQATLVALGLTSVWVFAWLSAQTTILGPRRVAGRTERLQVAPDGTPVIITYENAPPYYYQTTESYRDLSGEALYYPTNQVWRQPARLDLPSQDYFPGSLVNLPWRMRVYSFAGTQTLWHLVVSDQEGRPSYLVNYARRTRTRLGLLGTGGFTPTWDSDKWEIPLSVSNSSHFPLFDQVSMSPELRAIQYAPDQTGPMPNAAWDFYVIGEDNKLYRFDLVKQTSEVVLEQPAMKALARVAVTKNIMDKEIPVWRLFIRTTDEVIAFDANHQVTHRWRIPEQLHGESFDFYEMGAGRALAVRFKAGVPADYYEVLHFDDSGNPSEPELIELQTSRPAIPAFGYDISLVIPLPLVVDSFIAIGLAVQQEIPISPPIWDYLVGTVILNSIALALAVLAFLRLRRFSAPRSHQIAWPIYVFLLGPPGYIGFRFCRAWPVLEKCPACQQLAPQDRTFCAHCNAEFPLSVEKGTEVIA